MTKDGKLPLINRIKPNARHLIIENAIVSDFLTTKNHWDSSPFTNILLNQIINKIKAFPILITNLDDKIAWKFTSTEDFSVKTITWANNNHIPPSLESKNLE